MEDKEKVKCENLECPNNSNGYCNKLTYSQMLYNRIHCDEREW